MRKIHEVPNNRNASTASSELCRSEDDFQEDDNIVRGSFDEDYFTLSRHTAQDDRLSWAARGVLIYLLSLPKKWRVRVDELQSHGDIGRDALRRALRDLESYGYLSRLTLRDHQRITGRRIVIYGRPKLNPHFTQPEEQAPESQSLAQQAPENLPPENQAPENQATYKRESTEKRESKKTHTQAQAARPLAAVGVCSRHSLSDCRAYAEHLKASGGGITNPGGYATTIHRSGEADELIAAFLDQPAASAVAAAASAPGLLPPRPDCEDCHGSGEVSHGAGKRDCFCRLCPTCGGSGMEVVEGKGARPCACRQSQSSGARAA